MKRPFIERTFRLLHSWFGPQHWWPSRSGDAWEIVVGAVLTQNCAWSNVERALDGLEAANLTPPELVLEASDETLSAAIRPAGFFRSKSAYLRAVAAFYLRNRDEFASPCESGAELTSRRARLLSVQGVGRETADDILLYAFRLPVFVVDAYTRRVAVRHWGMPEAGTLPYDALAAEIAANLPRDVEIYAEYHALLIRLCKDSCRKKGCLYLCGRILNSSSDRSAAVSPAH